MVHGDFFFNFRSRNNDMKVLCQEVSELHLIGKKFCVDISATGLSNDFEKFGKCRVQELRGHSNPTIAFFRLQRQIDQNGNVKGLCSLCPIYQKQFSIRSTMWFFFWNLFFKNDQSFIFELIQQSRWKLRVSVQGVM